jgi:hypothetical protein
MRPGIVFRAGGGDFEHGNETLGFIRGGEFDWLKDD